MEIVRATISLISDEGVQNFSIRKLAKLVGVTEPAIYRHFESKDDLMIKLASYIARNWHEMMRQLPIQKETVVEQVRIMFREVMGYLDANREFTKTLFSADLFSTESRMTKILLELKNEGLTAFRELLTAGQSVGELRADLEAASVARIFFGSVWYLVTDWLSRQFRGELLSEWGEIWKSLVVLLAPR